VAQRVGRRCGCAKVAFHEENNINSFPAGAWKSVIVGSLSGALLRSALLRVRRFMPAWFAVILTAAAACCATVAVATEPPIRALLVGVGDSYSLSQHLSYLEDPERRLTVKEVAAPGMAARFRRAATADNDVNFGYSSSAYWLALPLRLDSSAPARWLLEIGYPSLDRVEVYLPRAGGGFDEQIAGDLQPFRTRPYPHRNLVFPLQLAPGKSQTVFLRVTSAGNLTIPATLWQPEALHQHDQSTYAGLSLYYGLMLALLTYSLLLFLSTREPVFIAYVAFIASMAVGMSSMNGFGNQFLWPDWPKWGNVALPSGMSATGFFGALFTRLFLGSRLNFPRLDRVFVVLAVAFAASALSPLFASYRFAAEFTSITGMVFSAVAVAGGVYGVSRGHPGARFFLLAWTLLLVGVAVLAARNMGWLPTNAFTFYSMQIGSALEMLLLSFAIADQVTAIRRRNDLAAQQVLAARQATVDTLRRSEQNLERHVAERTRELEVANIELRKKEQQLEHMAQHDPLTGLANRILLDDRLLGAVTRAKRSGRSTAVLVVDLDGFKEVNDAYGHAVGDQLLLAIAKRLTAAVREADTVARLGGDEFVVVVEDLNRREDAALIAEKLVSDVHRPVELAPAAVQISVSIGIACFPEDADTPEGLLQQADAAMYAAKSSGRNRWSLAIGREPSAGGTADAA